MNNTLADLKQNLRIKLNDYESNEYEDYELTLAINLAITETAAVSKSIKVIFYDMTAVNESVYSTIDIFEVLSVNAGGVELQLDTIPSINLTNPGWDNDKAEVPQKYIRINNGQIRLYPIPTTIVNIATVGYAGAQELVNDTDVLLEFSSTYGLPVILDRAEAELRRMHITASGNGQQYQLLMQRWIDWCTRISESNKGGK